MSGGQDVCEKWRNSKREGERTRPSSCAMKRINLVHVILYASSGKRPKTKVEWVAKREKRKREKNVNARGLLSLH